MKSLSNLHMLALFAVRVSPGRWLRFVGYTDELPIKPLWEECFSYEDYLGKAKPSTAALCRRLGIDVLFLIHVQRTARGKLFLERMEEIRHGLASAAPR